MIYISFKSTFELKDIYNLLLKIRVQNNTPALECYLRKRIGWLFPWMTRIYLSNLALIPSNIVINCSSSYITKNCFCEICFQVYPFFFYVMFLCRRLVAFTSLTTVRNICHLLSLFTFPFSNTFGLCRNRSITMAYLSLTLVL